MNAKIEVIFFTDPLCCWSWGFEPVWREFRNKYAGKIKWCYCMGGLIRDWNSYYDPVNNVYRPIHMGSMWLQAQQVTGVPMNHQIWINNPPSSSIPASIAFKSIEKQSPIAADVYLRNVREKLMLENVNISSTDVVLKLAEEIFEVSSGKISADQFYNDFSSGAGEKLLQNDFKKIEKLKIIHFPTLLFVKDKRIKLKTEGYQNYEQLISEINKSIPELKPSTSTASVKSGSKY